jgi:Xaa-Pro aminopeptidase
MDEMGIDCLLASSVNNVYYFTGYYAFEGAYSGLELGLLEAPYAVKSRGEEPILLLPSFDEGFYKGENRCIYFAKSVGGVKDRKIFSSLTAIDAIVQALSEKNSNRRIAVDRAFPLSTFRLLEKKLQNLDFVTDTRIFEKLRSIKSDQEISIMKKSAEILEYAIKSAYENLRPGMSEIEMVNEARANVLNKYKSLARDIEFGHLEVGNGLNGAIGAGTYPSDYRAQVGDVIHFDVGMRYKHYVADTCRDAVLGASSPEINRTHEVLKNAQEKTIESMKPGVKAADLFQIARNEIRKGGWSDFDCAYFGHGVGLAFHEDPLIEASDETILEPNMVLNIEIPASPPELGAFNVEDTCRITPSGVELLTKLSHDLFILGGN